MEARIASCPPCLLGVLCGKTLTTGITEKAQRAQGVLYCYQNSLETSRYTVFHVFLSKRAVFVGDDLA